MTILTETVSVRITSWDIFDGSSRDYRWQEYHPWGEAVGGPGSGSSYGSCVSISAPARNVVSINLDGSERTTHISGTSFAAPQVTGAVARYLQNNSSATPDDVWNWLVATSTTEDQNGYPVLNDPNGSAQRLLYMREACTWGSGGGPIVPTPEY
jgi:subtilisin family serine protease